MKTNQILEKAGGKTGYNVPLHYFDNVRSKIMQNLPEYQMQPQFKPSLWNRVKPYIYMAAMFAGIWCMMKMFHLMTSADLNLDNPPEAVVVAIANSDHADWIYSSQDNNDSFVIEDELSSQYTSIEDFKKDFINADI